MSTLRTYDSDSHGRADSSTRGGVFRPFGAAAAGEAAIAAANDATRAEQKLQRVMREKWAGLVLDARELPSLDPTPEEIARGRQNLQNEDQGATNFSPPDALHEPHADRRRN